MERGSRLGGPEQKLGSRARAGSAEARRLKDVACHFIAPALSCKHRCPHCAAVDPDMAAFSSIIAHALNKEY